MKKRFLALILLSASQVANAQSSYVYDGTPGDSVVFDFMPGDSLHRFYSNGNSITIDTTGCTLWQIGGTSKAGFRSGGAAVRGIMTDTAAQYRLGQDESFILKGWNDGSSLNPILSFEHRYQTTAGKDGGLVELSADGGTTWVNIFQYQGTGHIRTDSFYAAGDTITGGLPAFSGGSNGYVRSRLQLFFGIPLRPSPLWGNPVWVRFRFKSDIAADTLAGWAIRRIVLENDQYLGIKDVPYAETRLSFSPNPSATGVFHLDDAFDLAPGQRYEVRNALGAVVISGKPERSFDLSRLPKGLYWIRIWGKEGSAVGKVLWE